MEEYYEFDAPGDWEDEAAGDIAAEQEAEQQKLREAQVQVEKRRQRQQARITPRNCEGDQLTKDVTRALEDMKSTASSAGEALNVVKMSENATGLIADMPIDTPDEAEKFGVAVAGRLLDFAESPHFNSILTVVFRDIAREFKSGKALDTLNALKDKVSTASNACGEKWKRTNMVKPRQQEKADVASIQRRLQEGDVLAFDAISDKGGATNVPDGDDDFM